jgi:hypothetical protein
MSGGFLKHFSADWKPLHHRVTGYAVIPGREANPEISRFPDAQLRI